MPGYDSDPNEEAKKALIFFGGVALGLLALKALLEEDDDEPW